MCCWLPQKTHGIERAVNGHSLSTAGRPGLCLGRAVSHPAGGLPCEQPISISALGEFPVSVSLHATSFCISLVNAQLSREIIFVIISKQLVLFQGAIQCT